MYWIWFRKILHSGLTAALLVFHGHLHNWPNVIWLPLDSAYSYISRSMLFIIKNFKLVKCFWFFICFNTSKFSRRKTCGKQSKRRYIIMWLSVSSCVYPLRQRSLRQKKKSNWPTFYSLKIVSWGRRKVSRLRVVPIFPQGYSRAS